MRFTHTLVPVLLIAAAGSADAEIVHTVVNQAVTLPDGDNENYVGFDLTRDGVDDFEIGLGMYPWDDLEPIPWSIGFSSLGTAEILKLVGLDINHIIRYNEGDTIDEENTGGLLWTVYDTGGSFAHNGSTQDPTPNSFGGIYALRMVIDQEIHFGWLRLDYEGQWADGDVVVTVRDFAFNTVPDDAVFAGQVPAPGSVVLLATCGLAASRRRSRAF